MKKIFAIEDNETNFILLKEILSEYNVELSWAKDGKEFYTKIKRPAFFDLILMDLMLPDTNGIELTKFLIDKEYKIPVIFISAYTEKCEEIFDLGIEYFISKPIVPELFISIIKKYINLEKM
jgi:CheY-like chemotaxis protein